MNVVELTIVIVLFLLVTILGFAASRWRRAENLMHLDEWGLGGRSFGSWITWFLLGGDLYTAYTFVAVPALMFGAGAAGFFAVPYTVVIYPLVFLVVIRLWSVSHVRGFVTPADFVRSRFDSPTMALLVAITGIVATMPYIALQLVGISAILKSIGFSGSGLAGELPLLIAFLVLAIYTYNSGLRAPALIAFVKDALIYLTIIVAVIAIGALVPAAIMSIAAANLFTRNVYKEYLKKDASPRQEARVAKITSLVVKLGAVAAILFLNPQFSIDLQLIGGVIILQTL